MRHRPLGQRGKASVGSGSAATGEAKSIKPELGPTYDSVHLFVPITPVTEHGFSKSSKTCRTSAAFAAPNDALSTRAKYN